MKYYWLWLSCTLRPSGPTERLLIDCRFTYLISWRSLVLIGTVDKHVRFNVINCGYDFFRRQQRQTHQTLNDVLDVLITFYLLTYLLPYASFRPILLVRMMHTAYSGTNTRLR